MSIEGSQAHQNYSITLLVYAPYITLPVYAPITFPVFMLFPYTRGIYS